MSLIIIIRGLKNNWESFGFGLVFWSYFSNSNTSGEFFVNHLSQSGLTLNNTIWNFFVSAEMWHPKNQFNWIAISSNDHKFSFFLLNESSNMVQSTLGVVWFALLNIFSVFLLLSFIDESFFFVFFGLWLIFGQ